MFHKKFIRREENKITISKFVISSANCRFFCGSPFKDNAVAKKVLEWHAARMEESGSQLNALLARDRDREERDSSED